MTELYPPRISFRRLMAVKETSPNNFESIQLAWPPGIVPTRTFGGHVYAQAVYSASKTVSNGMIVHNATGHFLLPGRSDTPFTYRVRRIRDGGVYCQRSVDVYQETEGLAAKDPWRVERNSDTPCFVVTVSFKREERNSTKTVEIGHQNAPADHIQTTYASVLDGIAIPDHPRSPSADGQWFIEHVLGDKWHDHAETFPGVEIRKVDMKAYNGEVVEGGGGKAGDWRQLCFYRVLQDEIDTPQSPDATIKPDPETDTLNLAACAHIYASDRNSLFLIQRALGYEMRQASAGSLSHTVILHGSPRYLTLTNASDGKAKWFVQEAWTSNSGENRGCHESRLWDFEAGRILATTVQDGMMRVPTMEYVPPSKTTAAQGEGELKKTRSREGKL